MEDPVFMHYTSVLKQESPEWIVYQEVYETNKTYMRNVTAIEPEWLPKFAPTLCRLSDPLLEPPPRLIQFFILKLFNHLNHLFNHLIF